MVFYNIFYNDGFLLKKKLIILKVLFLEFFYIYSFNK